MKPFNKRVRLSISSYVDISFSSDGNLSISGSSHRSSGQCQDAFAHSANPNVQELVRIWNRWHLNDLRAGCEHQRNNPDWDLHKLIRKNTYVLNTDAVVAAAKIKEDAIKALSSDGTVTLNKDEQKLLGLSYYIYTYEADIPVNVQYYNLKETTFIAAGRLSHNDTPHGLLSKPCEVCGYKYGTAWLREEVPEDVLEWLYNITSKELQLEP